MAEKAEAELVLAFQGGDGEAFGELYRRRCSAVQRTAYLIVGNRSDSENVMQDTFVKVWQNLPKLKNPACFEAWLMRILVRTAWQYCRRRGSEQPVGEVLEPVTEAADEGSEPSGLLLASERRDRLWLAVNRLDIKQRTVIILHYYNEMSVQEIAAAIGVPVGTVKSRLFAARRTLRRELGSKGDEL